MSLKKRMQFLFLLLCCFIALLGLTGCSSEVDLGAKGVSEVEYLSSKFINILNRLNNITFENYQVTTQKATLSKESAQQEKTSTSTSSQSSEEGGEESTSGSSSDSENSSSDTSSSIIASQMSPNTILNPATLEIDWSGLKNEMENIYYAWNTILLDLHQLNISNDDILGFSSDLDTATTYIKNEDKANALLAVANLYSYMPRYLETISNDTAKNNVSQTRAFILNAYAFVEIGDWASVKDEIEKANDVFQLVTTDANFVSEHSYQVNKTYVELNELKNSLDLKDKEIFYIKYRNLLEEMTIL